ncbi:class I SAM-dependent methyltransferase [Streptomyces sp. AJS327]|uniref:class I SAM-dependent methyltransferase n=1 Tax=Streptomyces sp. AJS327 TaxID=2545265 RepID=UPI0015DE0B59|nr:class I SAM-dependent methyltransferase [Streptomyces sp. AJS327]MBA0050993.1 class I SAM-dependent methyltransferase [Streptomyces sp. AJS327]
MSAQTTHSAPERLAVTDYDAFGERYVAFTNSTPYNAFYDRPSVLGLAGPLDGVRVLEIGCAAGGLTGELIERGARVTAVDRSRRMLDLARERHGHRAEFRVQDVADPLEFAADSSYEVVTASLVMHYLEDWGPTLREVRRVLEPGGRLVLSTPHPAASVRWDQGIDYFRTHLITDEWRLGDEPIPVTFYHRPLSAICDALRDAGLALDRLAEPMPLPECETHYPDEYAWLTTQPTSLFVRAVHPADEGR